MYNGMSKIIPYKNHQCKEELEQINGQYIYRIGNINKNVTSITISIFVRNEGSHKAYNILILPKSNNITIHDTISELKPRQTKMCKITINTSVQADVLFDIHYDSI